MSHRKSISRGDKRRNARLELYRAKVARERAVLAIDLAERKQVLVVADHDSRVLARKTVMCRPAGLGPAIEWGRSQAVAAGFAGVTVVCEPTGYRWKTVAQLAVEAGVELVCVQPMLVRRAREAEDYTNDKSDDKDAMVIARLATQLHVYLPETPSPQWARLRQLGARRAELITASSAARQRIRDLVECGWPAAMEAAARPLDAKTWLAAMTAANCDPATIRRLGLTRFRRAVSKQMPRWGGTRACQPIVAALFAAAADDLDPIHLGALERAAFSLADLATARERRADVESKMVGVLDELDLTTLVTTIPGLSAVGAAAILAETGDLRRFDSARAVVKHAGLCPRANSSGGFAGKTTISGRGRPLLRAAAWRAIIGMLPNNPVYAARYQHLTTRDSNRLHPAQARIALSGALLRQLFVVVTARTPWDPIKAGVTGCPATRSAKEGADTAA